ncbi:MAG: hypothetical protein AAGD10_16820 [Myxococcota bacterium]
MSVEGRPVPSLDADGARNWRLEPGYGDSILIFEDGRAPPPGVDIEVRYRPLCGR